MKHITRHHRPIADQSRRGSTLVIVLALLSLLAFTGMVFYTFAAQERASAEYFSEAAKAEVNEPDDPFPWALEQMIVGANNRQKGSIVWSPTSRHSILRNQLGADIAPHTGEGVRMIYTGGGIPVFDQDRDGTPDVTPAQGNPADFDHLLDLRNFVDGMAVWSENFTESDVTGARDYQGANAIPQPDVDYTYPDINNLFVGYMGWAIRDNGAGASPRYERVQCITPSFFRPQYMKSGTSNGDPADGSPDVPTDYNWYDSAAHPAYRYRSFRPHPNHIGDFDSSGNPIYRYLDATRAADAGVIASLPGSSGEFPFRPNEGTATFGNSADFGKLGIWTGHDPDLFELDSDNIGDGTREGSWMDFRYPIQETNDGRFYATLHSFTILDLDGLIDLNIHGNLNGLDRFANVDSSIIGGGNLLNNTYLSRSNQGLGPHEISPIRALAPESGVAETGSEFVNWFTANPASVLEQANMELIWLITGRMDDDGSNWTDIYEGRWGDGNALWYHKHGGATRVNALPRPGRAGDIATNSNASFSFGRKQGFDDNADRLEGVKSTSTGRIRGFGIPLDYGARGSATEQNSGIGDLRIPFLSHNPGAVPERWIGYDGWTLTGGYSSGSYGAPLNDTKYILGRDGTWGTGDDLVANEFRDALLDDPLEMIVDLDSALRPDDQMFGIQDLILGHLPRTADKSIDDVSKRLQNLAPFAFADASNRSDRFTTLSNSLRYFTLPHQLGPNLIQDGGGAGTDDGPRWWEWTADTDGSDRDGNGFGDGDGLPEFPPAFGPAASKVQTYSEYDPFRPQVRRVLTAEAGEQQVLLGQLPLSINHLLDVNRNAQVPPVGTPRFLAYMQRAGLRFRQLTEHPDADEVDSSGSTAAGSVTSVPNVGTPAGDTALATFPPKTLPHREFWARRDRQKMARDIYVLLYTTGGAEINGAGTEIVDYTGDNSGRTLYSNERLRQMAQFAVNLVDALDTDNVVTKFEYDKNLGNGWGDSGSSSPMDDDPYTTDGFTASSNIDDTRNGMYPEDGAERGVVYGVEGQQLAFSEVFGVRSQDLMADNHDAPETDYDDETGTRFFMHAELQNMQPFDVPISRTEVGSTDEERALWRLVRVDRDGAASDEQLDITTGTADGAMSFMDGNPDVPAGGRYTIAMAALDGDPGNTNPVGFSNADMYIDHGSTGTFDLISPDVASAGEASGAMPLPLCDLDVIHSSHNSRWLMAGNSTQGGQFLDGVEALSGYAGNDDYNVGRGAGSGSGPFGAATTTRGFDLVLQRRQNPNLPRLPLADNPWIEVDRSRVLFRNLFDRSGATPVVQMDQIRSYERQEPLNTATAGSGNKEEDQTGTAPLDNRYNSIGAINDRNRNFGSASINPFDLIQIHNDRDFASTSELLHVPVVGPNRLTGNVDRMRYPGFYQKLINHRNGTSGLPAASYLAPNSLIGSAAGMFLWPDFDPAASPATSVDDNRWYRLMSFVEVPSRVNRMLGNYLNLTRLPGKLNPNGIRHREVYAGLIDNPDLANTPPLADQTNGAPPGTPNGAGDGPFLPTVAGSTDSGADSTPGGIARDRWLEFINERDGLVNGYDPTAVTPGARNHWIPGTPNSRPFRSLGYTTGAPDDNGLEETLLRRLSIDKPSTATFNRAGEGNATYTTATADPATNRHWLEVGNLPYHQTPTTGNLSAATSVQKHQVLSKIMNNTTTVSNCFIIYGTAAYFEALPDPGSGIFRIGGRMGLDLDGDADQTNDAGWERRAVFIIDRTELFNAYDPGSGSFDWERLVKYRVDLPSDGQ